jgi:NAD-dependent dihydropyrimidine dehydrogenase PreA subunit
MADLRYLQDVVTLELDESRCIGCGMCVNVCPHAVFCMENKKAIIIDRDACMECGACSKNCPVEAISVHSGVGCLIAIIRGAILGTKPDCDCSSDSTCC